MGTDTFFEDIEFGRKNKVRDFVLEEELVTIPEPIHTVTFNKTNSEPLQDIVIESPTQDDLVVHEEQTQNPQKPMLHYQYLYEDRKEKCYSRLLCDISPGT